MDSIKDIVNNNIQKLNIPLPFKFMLTPLLAKVNDEDYITLQVIFDEVCKCIVENDLEKLHKIIDYYNVESYLPGIKAKLSRVDNEISYQE